MKYRVTRIDPFRAARVAAAMYFLVGVAILPFLYLAFVLAPRDLGFSAGMILLSPFLTAGLGFASTALGCVVYNWVTQHVGAFEIDLHRHPPE